MATHRRTMAAVFRLRFTLIFVLLAGICCARAEDQCVRPAAMNAFVERCGTGANANVPHIIFVLLTILRKGASSKRSRKRPGHDGESR
jgi:hypothetical protein